ncbi:MAG: polyphenol oxidase family protein, partial [Candidatus Glassbacteria bacterium]|nr:polyphenol oxidase family protein [Candidatus Glassbacteria bacterium]
MERLTSLDRIKCLSFSPWEKVPGLCQGVTVRSRESESDGFFGLLAGELAARGFRFTARVRQVHGCRVVPVSASEPDRGALPEADGLAAAGGSATAFAVTVADCVPVFLLDTSSCCRAVLHAGWRGTAAGILER